jgi:NAD+ diphosphatase
LENYREPKYIPAYLPPQAMNESAWALIFVNNKILLKKAGDLFSIPEINELEAILPGGEKLTYIGEFEDHDCYCGKLNETVVLPENLDLADRINITKLTGDSELFILAGAASQILHWIDHNQYCGCCGHKTADKEDERAKICPNCGNTIYPRISPATITAIFRGDQILLAHNRNFRANLYSLIAGFAEPGETLEQCAAREIREEVGIKVKNIRYFSSQPWPFPDSLMVAFTAEYESGEITADQFEILDAGWYKADSMPEIPSADSIAGKIIRWYLAGMPQENKTK